MVLSMRGHWALRTGIDTKLDSKGKEYIEFTFGLCIGNECVHTIQDRYSLLREHYKDLPKLLAGCSATFPSKKVTKDTVNDNQTVRERARDLREFFAALLVSLHTAKLGRGHDVM